MLRGALESGLMRTLLRRADSRAFPVVVGTVALAKYIVRGHIID